MLIYKTENARIELISFDWFIATLLRLSKWHLPNGVSARGVTDERTDEVAGTRKSEGT
jgi:hypothetical protein